MSTILNEKIFGIGRYSNRNLKKAEKKLVKADDKYIETDDQIKKATGGDPDKMTLADTTLLDAKRKAAKERAKKYDKIDKSIEKRKDLKNNKTADKLINKEKFARKFDYSKMTPELKNVYNKKLEDRQKYISTGQGPKGEIRSRVAGYLKEEGNKFLGVYDNFPILSESYNPAELKESYTHEDFAELILENVVNAESLDTYQLLVLAESLGYEYLEEGKRWDKFKRGPGDTIKKAAVGALLTTTALAGSAGYKDYNAVKDIKSDINKNAQEINVANTGVDAMKDLQIQGHKVSIPTTGAEKESKRLESTLQALKSKRERLADDKKEAVGDLTKKAAGTGGMAAGAIALAYDAHRKDKKKNEDMEKYVTGKNKQIKSLKDKLKEKQEVEDKK